MQLLPHGERVDRRCAFAAAYADAEPLALAEVMPGDVDEERHAVLADHERAAALFHGPVPPRSVECGAHPHRRGRAAQPQTQVENRETEVEHGTPARLIPALPPSELVAARAEHVPAPPDAFDPAQLAALDEAANDLDVRPVAAAHADHHDPVALLGGPQDPLGAGRGHRERFLDQDVEVGRERGEDVRLVEVVGRADHDRVERLVAQHVLDVVERVLDAEAVRQRPGLGQIGVADGLHLDRLELLEHGEVRDLGNGPAADDPHLEALTRGSAGGHVAASRSPPPRAVEGDHQ